MEKEELGSEVQRKAQKQRCNLQKGKSKLAVRKKKITMMVVRTWNGGPKGVPIHRHIENLIVQV